MSKDINKVENIDFGFPDPCGRFTSWKQALVDILANMIGDLERYSLSVAAPKKLLKCIIEDKQYLNEIRKPKLCHGDLWPKNVLIKSNKNLRIVGLLDSERAFWGDPKAEWIILGARFAGQKSKKNHVFRCGLFSADYIEIPTSLSERFTDNSEGELFRRQIYLGIYLTQRKLESQRFPRNEQWIEEEFNSVLSILKATLDR